MPSGTTADPAAAAAALVRACEQVQRALDRSAAEYGVTPAQARLLGLLREAAPTIKELALLLGLDKSSTSGLVARAQARGLVRRVPSQVDRRSVRVRLTASGRELAADIEALVSDGLAALLEPLSAEERSALATALARLAAA